MNWWIGLWERERVGDCLPASALAYVVVRADSVSGVAPWASHVDCSELGGLPTGLDLQGMGKTGVRYVA